MERRPAAAQLQQCFGCAAEYRPVFALFVLQAEALRRAKVEVLRQIDSVHMQWQQAHISSICVVLAAVGYKQPRTKSPTQASSSET